MSGLNEMDRALPSNRKLPIGKVDQQIFEIQLL